jgi:hypothetical protein
MIILAFDGLVICPPPSTDVTQIPCSGRAVNTDVLKGEKTVCCRDLREASCFAALPPAGQQSMIGITEIR